MVLPSLRALDGVWAFRRRRPLSSQQLLPGWAAVKTVSSDQPLRRCKFLQASWAELLQHLCRPKFLWVLCRVCWARLRVGFQGLDDRR